MNTEDEQSWSSIVEQQFKKSADNNAALRVAIEKADEEQPLHLSSEMVTYIAAVREHDQIMRSAFGIGGMFGSRTDVVTAVERLIELRTYLNSYNLVKLHG